MTPPAPLWPPLLVLPLFADSGTRMGPKTGAARAASGPEDPVAAYHSKRGGPLVARLSPWLLREEILWRACSLSSSHESSLPPPHHSTSEVVGPQWPREPRPLGPPSCTKRSASCPAQCRDTARLHIHTSHRCPTSPVSTSSLVCTPCFAIGSFPRDVLCPGGLQCRTVGTSLSIVRSGCSLRPKDKWPIRITFLFDTTAPGKWLAR